MIEENIKNRKGSALLTALLVMGILIAVSLALSSLIFREVRITRSFIDSGQAYYSAESGVEVALYGLNTQLPGWQFEDGGDYKSFKVDDGMKTVGEVNLKNSCKAYPCFDEDEFDVNGSNGKKPLLKEFYDVIDLNESINIPLFVVKNGEDGILAEIPVKDFTVEFYSEFNPTQHLKFNMGVGAFLSGWDVLRWKVFGIRNEAPFVTESVSDFTALSALNGSDATNSALPSWFGTVDCDDPNRVLQDGRYSAEITCAPYAAHIEGICSNSQAREYYSYTYSGDGDDRSVGSEDIKSCYPIENFLDSHKLNYLSL
ncbi:MAG: pilus assembly PilX N-terminal domain-containing protein, partial [Patescibacteria group bacterium]